MKKLSKIFIMLCLLMGVVCLASCGGDDDDGNNNGGGSGSTTSLTIVKSNGEKYISLGSLEWASEYNVNGSLTDNASIYCLMTYEKGISVSYLYINLVNGEKSVNDFPSGYDLGNPTVNFGTYKSSENKYKYASGAVKVVSNNGKGFTLKFDNYKAERSSNSNIVINGTMYVEKEIFY